MPTAHLVLKRLENNENAFAKFSMNSIVIDSSKQQAFKLLG
jgi:hypothetical protein